jgi:hypothetical protein
MMKDANPLLPGVQDIGNVWLNRNGCIDGDAGNGCLNIDDNLSGIYDVDDPNDTDVIPEGLGAWETTIRFDHHVFNLTPAPD